MIQMQSSDSFQWAVSVSAAETAEGLTLDRIIFDGVLARALAERAELGGSLARRLGLGGHALIMLLALFKPDHPALLAEDYVAIDEAAEQQWLRDLLQQNRAPRETSTWLAAIIARRALEAGHLWADLGLPDRPTLRIVMDRHFPELSARNKNMRWKRFLYRCLCEEEGMSHCTSPTCSDCPEVSVCFEPDSAEATMALIKRAPA